ncbi:type IV toxin-antitoxin system AbiEi family antitoxin domain-containing protein [Pararhizobium sp. BT-229]|uniref:type IV toxin-antitoxin system AbiEi family antitoxin domain-containing protein n=1 Tax=Pararhizobium sp. BT-229 TaxID=2986923 RepID=UPI0021F7F44B|nr:type IV toxin-antitoxin system AbiEi family antitoxin [Pararhizobium sp. BT-229]MCV9964839.1 type IV toxin-antitoxin system AbiEi family antitoxin domain-containing protein [Pararhizobium sp. BT-229]
MATESFQGFDFNVRTLGPLEAKLVLSMEERRLSAVDTSTAAEIVGHRRQAMDTLARLHRKGWLERVGRGRYALHSSNTGHLDVRVMSPLKFASAVLSESYVGWWAAAEHHGLTWQHPTLIRVASRKQQRAIEHEGYRIEFVSLADAKFFGFAHDSLTGITVSSIEKTVVDCVDKPRYAGGHAEVGIILGNALEKIAAGKLVDCAIQNDSVSTVQRLGFFLDTVRPNLFDAVSRSRLLGAIGETSRGKMGNPEYRDGDFGYLKDWKLQVNLNRNSFLSEVDRFGE